MTGKASPYEHEFHGFKREEKKPFFDRIASGIYDTKTGSFLGRTPLSWAKILLFYTIFYGVLAALVAICMWAFFLNIDPRTPKWQQEYSIIGTNPGLGFRPLPPEDQVESTLIWYKGTDKENYKYWTDSLTSFLANYKTLGNVAGLGQNIHDCEYDKYPDFGQVCEVDVKNWHPCTLENNFNYHKSAPCIFLKLNRIYGWTPEFYEFVNETANDLPDNMPVSLKLHIKGERAKNPNLLQTIWVSCEGENPADVESIGPVKYYPRQGFPGYYYPYVNSEGYLSPLIAVHFERPKTGILINIECRAWARNIKHDRHDKLGSVHLELMID